MAKKPTKAAAIREYIHRNPDANDNAVAKALKVSPSYVWNVRKSINPVKRRTKKVKRAPKAVALTPVEVGRIYERVAPVRQSIWRRIVNVICGR